MDKPLSAWTLLEVKAYCKSRGKESGCCEGCLFMSDRGYCITKNIPDEWDISEENAATAAADTNVPDKHAKPRLTEMLGVEVGQKFMFQCRKLWIDEQGLMHDYNGYVSGNTVCDVINHPESIIRAPLLTEAELERCRVYGAKWVSKDPVKNTVNLWREKPELTVGDIFTSLRGPEATANDYLFPSVRCGCCIQADEECVEEVQE